MNTNNLKRFAQNARRKLMEQVAARLEFILTTDSPILREKGRQIEELKKDLQHTGKAQLIEKVAYTWFNRLVALRYMDANDYQPSGIRVITPAEGFVLPQALNEAKQGHIPEGWRVNRQHILDLLDGKIPSANAQNEVFRELLIAACNHLNTVFPFLFERIDDYTELLLPDDLTSQFSVVHDVVEGMADEDCREVEVIGWLYQFYISEKKDEVFASKSKVKKEDIPAATQLFTPRWIVEYMVQNTVGKLWLMNRPNSRLKEHMPYYIEPAETVTDYLKINSPADITLLDQACGSGHILVYGFELLSKIYEEEGYNPSEIPAMIIENNLHGFEIDSRAAQLSGFALMMKAREHYRRVFRKELKPNIHCFSDLTLNREEIVRLLKTAGISATEEMLKDLVLMQQATNFGSLIQPLTSTATLEEAALKTRKALETAGLFDQDGLRQLATAFQQLAALSRKFTCIVENPPYMGDSKYNPTLSEFIYSKFSASKLDIMACFMEVGISALKVGGFLAIINQHSWMFISSYSRLRETLLNTISFDNMLHLGTRTFPEIGGEVVQNTTFVVMKIKHKQNKTKYFRLVEYDTSDKKRLALLNAIKGDRKDLVYIVSQQDFNLIPNNNICYWFTPKLIQSFTNKKIGEYAISKAGIVSGNDSDFLRLWFEISWNEISINEHSFAAESNVRWVPVNKGGGIRRYFGNEEYIINIKNLWLEGRTNKSVRRGDPAYYFKEAITWTMVCGTSFSFRYSKNCTFATAAPALFFNSSKHLFYSLGFLNSKIANSILPGINPTINLGSGDVTRLPLIQKQNTLRISELVLDNISISENEWDSREVSWNFKQNELISLKDTNIENTTRVIQNYWKLNYFNSLQNEEELNRIFIDIYGLQDELTPDVPLEEITILQQELDRTALAKLNNKLKRDPETRKVLNYDEIELPFDAREVMAQLVSYAVGCMFGRYSLDKEGLILANQGETLQDYIQKTGISAPFINHFMPDEDNIIPVLDEDWFEDDITGRFRKFLKTAFGTEHFEENLAFVEQCLGKDIRTYFARDFYGDHIRRYKKRPIYWMFSSPRGAFNVLIYMHRYTPDTVSNILNGYLRQYQEKLRLRRQHLQHVQVTGTGTEKTQALKETERIDRILIELHEYERDILYPLAAKRIAIDLDDGVLVNYNRFGKAIKEVAGLNDATTKKKVKAFDWVDTSNII